MTFSLNRFSLICRPLARIGLIFAAIIASLVLTATEAMALPSGTVAAYFTLSQSNWYAGSSVGNNYSNETLTLQSDGNLVLYYTSTDGQLQYALWASGTNGKGVTQVDWSASGYAKLQDSNGNTICTLGALNPAPGGTALLQNDGNFVFYNTSGNPTWATGTNNLNQGNTNYCYS